jgi:hypothetical protein
LFGHIARDSTAAAAREKGEFKTKVKKEEALKRRGRPKKGEVLANAEPVEESMLQKQLKMSKAELLKRVVSQKF